MIARASQKQRDGSTQADSKTDKQGVALEVVELVRLAKGSNDGRLIVDSLAQIAEAKGFPNKGKVAALQEVLESKKDINIVAIEALHNLRLVSPQSSSAFARELLAEPPSDDREMVHASAVAHLITLGGIAKGDFELISRLIGHPLPEVRSTCQRSLRGIGWREQQALVSALVESPSEETKDLRIFMQTLPAREAGRANVPKVQQEGTWSEERKKAASSVARARTVHPKERLRAGERTETPAKVAAGSGALKETVAQQSKPSTPVPVQVDIPKADTVLRREDALPGVDGITVFQASRNAALRNLNLDALRTGANSAAASATEVMANLAELAVMYGAATAAESMGRLVYLLSDPNLPAKEAVQTFATALVREASLSLRTHGSRGL